MSLIGLNPITYIKKKKKIKNSPYFTTHFGQICFPFLLYSNNDLSKSSQKDVHPNNNYPYEWESKTIGTVKGVKKEKETYILYIIKFSNCIPSGSNESSVL